MSLGTMEQRTEGMKRQAQELIEQAYQRGFKAGKEKTREDIRDEIADAAMKGASKEKLKELIKESKDIIDSYKFIEQGRNEAWEAARKIYLPVTHGGLSADEIKKIFDTEYYGCLSFILNKFSASEAIEKLRAYEKKHEEPEEPEEDEEIKVGDEVILNVTSSWEENTKAIVIADEKTLMFPYNVMISSGDTDWVDKDDINRKTGRHFPEIVESLKKLKEDKK